MIMIKKKGFLIFTIIISISILLIGAFLTYFAYQEGEKNTSFPTYRYEEYIDKSDLMSYSKDDGGQLYESEKCDFSSGVSKIDVVGASEDKCLYINEKGSSISYNINSLHEDKCLLVLNIAYVSSFNRDIPYQSLLEIRIDNTLYQSSATIKHSYNKYEFNETSLFSFNIHKGINNINIFSLENDVYFDYLALIPSSQRNSDKKTIGERYYSYKGNGSSQSYQIERGKLDNALIVDDGDTTIYRSVFMFNINANVTYLIDSDSNKETLLKIHGKKTTDIDALIKIECGEYVKEITFKNKDTYQEYDVGNISLIEGNNVIKFTLLSGEVYLDKFSLNADINHSLYNYSERFELEDALINGAAAIEEVDTASERKSVGSIAKDTSFYFNINSPSNDEIYLSLSISYWGDDGYLSDALAISINENDIDISDVEIKNNDRDFFNFKEIYLSSINLNNGNNSIVITSKMCESFNLDYLSINHKLTDLSILECEHMSLFNGSRIENNYQASNHIDVGYNRVGSGISIPLLMEEDDVYHLSICLSINSSQLEKASNIFAIYFNNEMIDITQVYLLPTEGWTNFRLNEGVASLQFKKGLNILSVVSLSELYNLDYISLL